MIKLNLADYPQYISLFYKTLNQFGYDTREDIRTSIAYLGQLNNPYQNKEIIKYLLASPVIQDISYDEKGQFTIYSEKYGKISFFLAHIYFKDNNAITMHLKKSPLENHCFAHTDFLAS